MAANGARVYIVGRRQDRLDTAVKQHSPQNGGQLIALPGDVTSKDDLSRLASGLQAKEGVLHILVNAAGIAGTNEGPQTRNVSGGAESKAEGKDAKDIAGKLFAANDTFATWDDVLRTNVSSVYFASVAFLPLLEEGTKKTAGWSSAIINITSISGITKQSQAHFAYNSSKGAAIHLTEMLATELANNSIPIRVNSIAPGVYPSEMTAMSSDESNNKSFIEKQKFANIPARRPGKDEDMASACLFLATNQYINGQTVPVDGGL